jgi:hypothetical protein
MKLHRKGMLVGLTALVVAAAVAGGVGVAQAAAGTAAPTARPTRSAPHGYGGMHAMMAGQQTCLAAAADYLGLSQADLQAQLAAGRSLADVAAARGRSVSGLEDAMIAAVRSGLDADPTLTAAQRASILERMSGRIDAMVRSAHPAGIGGMGMMGGGGMPGMGW